MFIKRNFLKKTRFRVWLLQLSLSGRPYFLLFIEAGASSISTLAVK